MSSTSGIAPLKFVSETEIEEKRKKRQEEWEKVRQPHQPLGDLTCFYRCRIISEIFGNVIFKVILQAVN